MNNWQWLLMNVSLFLVAVCLVFASIAMSRLLEATRSHTRAIECLSQMVGAWLQSVERDSPAVTKAMERFKAELTKRKGERI